MCGSDAIGHTQVFLHLGIAGDEFVACVEANVADGGAAVALGAGETEHGVHGLAIGGETDDFVLHIVVETALRDIPNKQRLPIGSRFFYKYSFVLPTNAACCILLGKNKKLPRIDNN